MQLLPHRSGGHRAGRCEGGRALAHKVVALTVVSDPGEQRRIAVGRSSPFQRRTDWGITAGPGIACLRFPHTGNMGNICKFSSGSLLFCPTEGTFPEKHRPGDYSSVQGLLLPLQRRDWLRRGSVAPNGSRSWGRDREENRSAELVAGPLHTLCQRCHRFVRRELTREGPDFPL